MSQCARVVTLVLIRHLREHQVMKAILLFGGRSDERLVSVASAQNLSRQYPFDEIWFIHFEGALSRVTTQELAQHARPFEMAFLPQEKPFAENLNASVPQIQNRVVFIGMHGTEGEDGEIQALFEKNRIAFTGSSSSSSKNCFDKVKTKEIVRMHNLALADEMVLRHKDKANWTTRLHQFLASHGKIVIKPVASGSSFGLYIVSEPDALKAACETIMKDAYSEYLVEAFLEGRELTVGVHESNSTGSDRGLQSLPASEVILSAGHLFDYQGKYLGRGNKEVTPAELNAQDMARAQKLAIEAHKALDCYGYTRTDMMLTEKGPVFIETNTLPGLSKASFVPQQLAAAKISMTDFITKQIELASHRYS